VEYDVPETAPVQRGTWELRCFEGKQFYIQYLHVTSCLKINEHIANIHVFSKNYKPDGLGSWVKANRRAFKNKKLVQDRIDRLNAAGFSFTSKYSLFAIAF
jgi:hypothetical protein